MKLRDIAHSRTGDKGNTSNISVIAYDAKHYPLLLRAGHRRAGARRISPAWSKARWSATSCPTIAR